jgi:NDP-sugar pyrophosphorylase family protein
MQGLTEDIPKPMLRIAGKPLLEHILQALREAGIDRYLIVTGYRAEQIEQHFGHGSALGVTVRCRRQVVQDGTARALLLARDAVGDQPFLLAWGDILTDRSNYPGLLRSFTESGADAVLSVNWVEDPFRGAAVYFDEQGRIERIHEKPPRGTATTHWNNAGIAVFRPLVFDYAAAVRRSPRGEYEIPDAIGAMIAAGLEVRAFPLQGAWTDVGTPEDLRRAEEWLRNEESETKNGK